MDNAAGDLIDSVRLMRGRRYIQTGVLPRIVFPVALYPVDKYENVCVNRLFCVFDCPAFADQVDLDLAGILESTLDFYNNIARHKRHLFV